ncbi:MAG: hypothetical protein AAF728_17510 [Cyanobacteria bacterium P01_D01_bin.128]
MKPSLKFLTWIAIAGVAWSAGAIYNVYLGGELSWLRGMYQRKVALAQEIDQPKLIVTGGSGAHYTINAELMEAELGLPVINLGIDGPVGLDVILPSVLSQVKPGDTVLLIPEYLLLLDEDGLGDRSGPFGWAIGQPGLGGVPPKQVAQDLIVLGVPSLRAVIKSTGDLLTLGRFSGYYDDPLTERGDPTQDKYRQGDWWQLEINDPISDHALDRIEQFKQEVEAQGGTLLLALPWVYAKPDGETLDNVIETAEQLSEIAPLLYDSDTFNIQSESDLFADTHYHLLEPARNLRSEELAAQLQDMQL